jgi:hypothetical protein
VAWFATFYKRRVVLVDFVRHLLQELDARDLDVIAYVFVTTACAFDKFQVGRYCIG